MATGGGEDGPGAGGQRHWRKVRGSARELTEGLRVFWKLLKGISSWTCKQLSKVSKVASLQRWFKMFHVCYGLDVSKVIFSHRIEPLSE